MPYIPHTKSEVSEMLKAIGLGSMEELLSSIPEGLRLKHGLRLPKGLSEQELKKALARLSERNGTVSDYKSFLGGGAYNHYVPSLVGHVTGRSEFYTAYTPYQPEVSQGTLQAIFEYQTIVCQMTGMDVANASLYDGASAVAEALLMARRITGRQGVVLSSAMHPFYRATCRTYLKARPDSVREAMYCGESGATLPEAISAVMDDSVACVVIQQPNFFGSIEDIKEIAGLAHRRGALLIHVTAEPVSLGLLRAPGEDGADIAVGENQSFGSALNFGGPYLGFMATRKEFLRQLPGRVVGQSVDRSGKRAFCLTLSTREQHIRRERATSNICTNHGLSALSALAHLLCLGRQGLRDLAVLNASKADFLRKRLLGIRGVDTGFISPVFNEFTVKTPKDPEEVLKGLLKRRIMGGIALRRFYPELKDHVLVCATEMNPREDMEAFADSLSAIIGQ